MNEPLKNPSQQPESYQPRTPEIVNLVEQAQGQQAKALTENILRDVPQKPSGDFEGIAYFPKFLKVASDYLGDPLDYTYAIAASGGAFRLAWDTASWNGGSGDISHTYDNREAPFRNGITALGREFRILWREDHTKEEFKAFIREQIDAGRPVISLGPVGPPEAGLIVGYRDSGDTLLGWSDFQDWGWMPLDDEGRFVTDSWWEGKGGNKIHAVMSLGEITGPRMGEGAVLRNAIAALEGRRDGSFAKGVAAYDAWKKALLGAKRKDVKGKVAGNDMGDWLLLVAHGEPLNTLADGRKNAQRYFSRLAQEHPEQPLYAEIAGAFGTLVEILLKKVYRAMRSKATHGFEGSPKQKKAMARRGVRREIAGYIDEMKAADEKALALMKELLAALEREATSNPGHQPESYQPCTPEIVSMVEQAQDRKDEPEGPQAALAGKSQSSLALSSVEIRVIRIPKMKMVSSGPLTDEQVFGKFDNWWGSFDLGHYITPRDFMQFNREKGCMEQLFAVPKGFRNRLRSRRRYKTVNFPGGLYAVGTAKDIPEDGQRLRTEMLDLIEKSEWFALSDSQNDSPERYELTHVITPKIFKEKCGYHLSDLWIPIIVKE